MKKYICDCCGKEVGNAEALLTLMFVQVLEPDEIEEELGDYCEDCQGAILTLIKGDRG